MYMYSCLLLVASLGFLCEAASLRYVTIETALGKLRGKVVVKDEGTVTQFLGVPYSKPPVGERRFALPQPLELWTGVKDAVTNGPWCAQNNKKEWSEDCLYMNIYIPRPLHQVSNTSSLKLPVLVYYHGGNHQVGGANGKDGSFLALHGDVIVVIPNYRLGVFGFLGAVDGDVPGNYGLWDQLQALRWIRGNIGTLGGDPGSVTISGESAGARGVAQLLLYTGEELFHRAICASGPAIGSRGFNFEPKHLNEALVKELNCGPVSNTQAMLDCLRKVPAATLLEKATRAAKTAGLTWWPSPDGKMFKDHPLHLRQSNKVRKVPLMVGTNSHEGYITQQLGQWPFDLSLGINKTVFEENVRASMKKLRYLNRDSPPAFTALALKLYGAGQRVDYSEGLVNFNSDLMFIAGSVYEARLQSKVAKVYYYNLAHKPIKRFVKLPSWIKGAPSFVNASHADDLYFIFGGGELAMPYPMTPEERNLSKVMMTAWTNFAKTGDPNPVEPGAVYKWRPFTETDRAHLDLTTAMGEGSVKKDLYKTRMALWNDIRPTLVAISSGESIVPSLKNVLSVVAVFISLHLYIIV